MMLAAKGRDLRAVYAEKWPWSAAVTCALALFGASGCDAPITPLELVDKTRVLGAKVEVADDPTRAAPLPGEAVTVRWLVAAPDPNAAFAYRFSACVARDAATELPSCAGDALADAESLEPTSEAPSIAFAAPADASGDERLAVLGAVCPAGHALVEGAELGCSEGARPAAASVDFAMDDGNHPNSNPTLTDVALDQGSLPDTGGATDCAELPTFKAGKHRLAVELGPDARDPIEPVNPGDPTRESLLLSYFVTWGELDHAFTAIDSGSNATGGSVLWTAPPHGTGPTFVRLFFVVRDGRGGSDFTERRVCVVP
jgi:hypothetical protein